MISLKRKSDHPTYVFNFSLNTTFWSGLRAPYNQTTVSYPLPSLPSSLLIHFSCLVTLSSTVIPVFGTLYFLFPQPGKTLIDRHLNDLSSPFGPQFRCHLLRPSLTSSCAILQPLYPSPCSLYSISLKLI